MSTKVASRGRVKRITIGQYPAVSVGFAREEALRIKAAVSLGRDPATERSAERQVLTFRDLTEIYIERYAKPHKRTWQRDAQMLAGYLTSWNNRRLSELTAAEVARLHERLGRENGRYAANRTVALLRTIFNLARDWGYLKENNPAARVKFYREESAIAFSRRRKYRALTKPWPTSPIIIGGLIFH